MIHALWQNAEDVVERNLESVCQNFEQLTQVTHSAFTVAIAALGQVLR